MIRTLLALALLSIPAAAQQILWHAGFENGLAGWTATGLWNAEAETDPCGALVAPFPAGDGAAYYGGSNGNCNYDTPGIANSGNLTWDGWIELPEGAASITLQYMSWSHSEFCWGGWDEHLLWIEVEGSASLGAHQCEFHTNGPSSVVIPWHQRVVDLTGLGGRRVRPRFEFSTIDENDNFFGGWFLDEVRIVAAESGVSVCPTAGSACPCSTGPIDGGCLNSTGNSGNLAGVGATQVSADTLTLHASNLPTHASCLLVQAAATGAQVHFGDGVRCVSGSVLRLGALTASQGNATWPAPGGVPISVRGGVPSTGGTRYYYAYYRDVMRWCTSATFNLTDTQRIVWTP